MVFGRACRDARLRRRLSQRDLATAVGLSRAYVSMIERGRANPSLAVVERIGAELGLDLELLIRTAPTLEVDRQRDLVHARCSGYVERRLRAVGWHVAREAEVIDGRLRGWIDLLAFDPNSETLLVIEVKTRLADIGLVERQLGWYGRLAVDAARRLGWRPRRIVTWLLVLASDEVDSVIGRNRDLMTTSFPLRAVEMMAWLGAGRHPALGRGLAMIDPASKRRAWLIRTRVDGRRSPARYSGYADATRRFGAMRAGRDRAHSR